MADGCNTKMKFSERRDVFKDLLRFLKTEKVKVDGMLHSKLQELYTNQYTVYRKQIDPSSSGKLPEFSALVKTAKESKLLFRRDTKVFLHRLPPLQSETAKKGSTRRGQSSSESNTSHEASQSADPAPRSPQPRKRKGPRRIAVDQHLTFMEKLAPMKAEVESQEDVTNYMFIKQDGKVYVCSLCKTTITSKMDTLSHVKGKRHRLALCVNLLQRKKEVLFDGQFGISIISQSDGEKGTYMINSTENKEQLTDMTITNYGNVAVELLHCEMLKRLRVFKLMDQKKVTDGTGSAAVINPGDSYRIQVRMLANHIGSYHCPVMFHFGVPGQAGKKFFFMVRYLQGHCTNSIVDELKPATKYKRPPQVAKLAEDDVEQVPGIKPISDIEDKLERKIKLDPYRVPQTTRKMINRGLKDSKGLTESEQSQMQRLRSILDAPVCMSDYTQRFQTLLYCEEVQMEVDIRKYDMTDVKMKVYQQNKKLLVLAVPGLAEKRPSVLVGDWLYVRVREPSGKLSKKEYQGYVHAVLQNEVALGFTQKFRDDFVENKKFSVRFVFNRLPLCLQHRACQLARELTLDKILFPDNSLPEQYVLPKLTFYNRTLENNLQQKCAVEHIVAGTSRPAPYIVFGPPGTGKTVTIVEAIKQIWKQSGDTRVLACTPSNSASDLIATRLVQHIPRTSILRLNAKSRTWSTVPDEIKNICNFDKQSRQFYIPDMDKLKEYRIIVCTLVTAGRLVSANFPPGHFSHVFVDEAGHAVEPEALIPIAGILEVNKAQKNGGQVVLAGDPKQLGPVLRSPLAIKYGLNTSLLERYMNTIDMYIPKDEVLYERTKSQADSSSKNYDPRVITKLLQNYRSHPAILKQPNEMFYDSELKACASIDREKLCKWEELPKKGFPVLFHGVIGEDMREERSPSFFNPEEVALVVSYVEKLMNCRQGGIKLKQTDIGVISPYRKQVQKISKTLNKMRYGNITVGSVEEFQGAERTVIIVSTVRSKPEYMSLDFQYKLGFLRNPKRFNVTITRAKALLIVIGNPDTLRHDPHWKSFIEYCECEKSCLGVHVGEEKMTEEDQMEDLNQRLQYLQITDKKGEMIVDLEPTELSEQPWRNEM